MPIIATGASVQDGLHIDLESHDLSRRMKKTSLV